GDGIDRQRFGGHLLNDEPGADVKRFERGLRAAGGGLDAGHHVVEIFSIDEIGELVGVFVGDPEAAGVDPCAIAGAVFGDGGSLADLDFFVPAFLHGDKEVEGGAGFIGEKDVVEAIFVDIDKAQAGVVAVGIDYGGAFGQGEDSLDPAAFTRMVFEDGGLGGAADDQFAAAVVVQIAKADGVEGNTIEAGEEGWICAPLFAVESESAVGLEDGDIAAAIDDSKMRFGVDGGGKIKGDPGIGFWGPEAALFHFFVADDDVDEAVIVKIDKPHAVIA